MVRLFTRLAPVVLLLVGCTLNAPAGGGFAPVISGAPTVRIASPLSGARYLEGVVVNIAALVGNAGGDIDRVEILLDGQIIATLPQPNEAGSASFTVNHAWNATGIGEHTVDVTAFRGDGSRSAPAPVTFSVIDADSTEEAAPAATEVVGEVGGQAVTVSAPAATTASPPTTAPTTGAPAATSAPQVATAAPTNLPAAAAPPTTASTGPTANFTQNINVRRGPGTIFNPTIGSFRAGESAEILALNPAGDWLKVRFGGGEGWVFRALVTVNGDISTLPRDPGPPIPTAPPATSAPPATVPAATAPPATTANLVTGIVVLAPSQPVCGETFTIGLDVANLGNEPTASGGTVSVRDLRAADSSVQQTTEGGFPVLQPGQTFRVEMRLTVSTFYEEDHRLELTVDPANSIPETDNNNSTSLVYRLLRGSCP